MKQSTLIILLIFSSMASFANKERWDKNKQEWSELMISIYNGQNTKFTKLIQQGVNINYVTPGVKSDWRLTALEVAIRKDNGDAVKALLQTNKIVHPEAYFMTACGQNTASTIDLLIKFGANPNDTLENGYSVLMYAASFGSNVVLESLLKHGAHVKQKRKVDGITALMLATSSGKPQKVKLLLDYKADKKDKNKNGETALDYVDDIYPYLKISEKTKSKLRELLK
jgi:ankyrin repeat protein